MPIQVVAIEDHPLMLKAILQELEAQPDIQVVGTATHGAELHRLVRQKSPDVVVLDMDNIETKTSISNPHQYSKGVEYLLINGKVVIDGGRYNGTLAGDVIKLKK